jgi:hypothetical protein
MNKLLVLLALFALALASTVQSYARPEPVHALASENIRTFTGSVNAETTIITGATGHKLHLRTLEIATDTSGVVVMKDGTGGATVLNLYLIANTPRDLSNLFGAGGLSLTQNKLTATEAGATLTLTARTSDE